MPTILSCYIPILGLLFLRAKNIWLVFICFLLLGIESRVTELYLLPLLQWALRISYILTFLISDHPDCPLPDMLCFKTK